ncbi:conserved hypothetical protein [Culex quinquefasciatus]|uniref:Adenylate kinase n=1 Tax=Culex quinquefasciatus TaxID=7176 RepID=B0WIQ9_CULQU|nr:conserved hypothetical protein [Culex quinquefasciatus]|eukprot:XP_001848593.1 conserved hypothetical protein [Culex quinquefasciatus]
MADDAAALFCLPFCTRPVDELRGFFEAALELPRPRPAFGMLETLVARIMKRASESATVRADDNEETLKTRIATFRENTEKILVQYPTQLRRINAERAPEEIFAEVEKSIDELLAKKGKKA